MHQVTNFLLTSRIDTPSLLEKVGDRLLTPARVLFGGKRVLVFPNQSMHISEQLGPKGSAPWIKVALKIVACITLPIAAIGVVIKLICFKDPSYRVFCAQKIPESSTCQDLLLTMFQHIHATADFTTESGDSLKFTPLGLSECRCMNTGAFHRLRSPRRNNLENAVVQRLVDTRPDKKLPIRLLSMGSGGLMSDFLTLEKLVLAGFTSICIDCVDIAGINAEQVGRIQEFFEKCKEVSITIQGYSTIDSVPPERTGYAAVLAIDYDDLAGLFFNSRFRCTADLMKAYDRLDTDGFVGLGFSDEDILFGPNMTSRVLSSRSTCIYNLTNDLTKRLPQKESIMIGLPYPHFEIATLAMFSLALAVKQSHKGYGTISLVFIEDLFPSTGDTFKTMMSALFPARTIQIVHEPKEKFDLLFTGSYESQFSNREYLAFLKEESTTYILYPQGKIFRQNSGQEEQRVRIL